LAREESYLLAIFPDSKANKQISRSPAMKKSSLWSKFSACIGIFIAFFLPAAASQAAHNGEHSLSTDDWRIIGDNVDLLEPSGLMPMLMPTIMLNRDALQLTDEQVNAFHAWRNKNYTNMVHVMSEIIDKMVQFRVASLSPDITNERMVILHSEIQDLQRQALVIKLSCRELIMTTFTDAQWEDFAFVVADNPKLASLVSQVNNLDTGHAH
jgi:hypothetical protein